MFTRNYRLAIFLKEISKIVHLQEDIIVNKSLLCSWCRYATFWAYENFIKLCNCLQNSMFCNDLYYGYQLLVFICIKIKIYDKMFGIKKISNANCFLKYMYMCMFTTTNRESSSLENLVGRSIQAKTSLFIHFSLQKRVLAFGVFWNTSNQ